MFMKIDLNSIVPVYTQIKNNIQFAIASGVLKPGDRLPSVRELSEQINVNPNTVAKSYRDLEVSGYLYTRRGMGVFVNQGIEAKCREDSRRQVILRLHEAISEAKAAGMSADEITEVVAKSLQIEGPPYGPTPPEVLQVASRGLPGSNSPDTDAHPGHANEMDRLYA